MAIKKVRIKPPGYTDIVHPETSADVVKFSDGSTVEAHKAEDATQAHLPKNVGLGNVDNVKQASKTEFDEHDNDATRHITSVERTKWNTVDNKVDKVTGKGLSTNDYTTAEKNKLSGIQAGAQVNTVTSVAGKTGEVTLVKGDVGLSNVDNVQQATKVEHEALDTKVTSHLADGASHSKTARFVVGTSTAGWTLENCDYLCDGTDDQEEIIQALDDLPATGGEVVILDGTYNITASINIPKDNVSIRGSGNATILKRMYNSTNTDSGPTAKGLITLNEKNGCKIQGLQIDGNKATYTASYNYGIYLSSSSNNTITSNTYNNNSNGIDIYASSNNNTITSNTYNNSGYGIRLYLSSNNTVTSNTCNNGSDGIRLYSSSNNTVTGNTCNKNSSYGIYLSSSSNNTVTGNTCNNNSSYGIYLSSSSNNTVTGNTCIRGIGQPSDYTSSQYTIYLSGSSNRYNLISSNNCMGKAVVISGGTGNSAWGNKYDSGDDLPIVTDNNAKITIGKTQPDSGWWFEEID